MEYSQIIQRYQLSSLAVIGSRARGDFGPSSDLDLIGIGRDKGFFIIEEEGEPYTELHVVSNVEDWKFRPRWWYALRDMRVIEDDGSLAKLFGMIDQWQSDYVTPEEDIVRNLNWLKSTMRKLKNPSSDLLTSYRIETSLWEILAGAFISRNMPVPANSEVYRLAPEILGRETFDGLILGDVDTRKRIASQLCEQITTAHNKSLHPTTQSGALSSGRPQPLARGVHEKSRRARGFEMIEAERESRSPRMADRGVEPLAQDTNEKNLRIGLDNPGAQ